MTADTREATAIAAFVVDTVGEVTNPNGDTFRGVILGIPHGTSPDAEKAALRAAARMFAARVTIAAAETEPAE
jgi:hypothetical protein